MGQESRKAGTRRALPAFTTNTTEQSRKVSAADVTYAEFLKSFVYGYNALKQQGFTFEH